jgi:hypothetical protein
MTSYQFLLYTLGESLVTMKDILNHPTDLQRKIILVVSLNNRDFNFTFS